MKIKLFLIQVRNISIFLVALTSFYSCPSSETSNSSSEINKKVLETNIDYGVIRIDNFDLYNNVWGKAFLQADSIYSNSLRYNVKNKTVYWDWNWPFEAQKELKGYPSIVIGDKPFPLLSDDSTTDARFPLSINKIKKMTFYGNFNAISDGEFNYAFDLMVLNKNNSRPDNIKIEIMVWLISSIKCKEEKRDEININGFWYDIYVNTSWNPKTPYVAFVLRGKNVPQEIPIHRIFDEVDKIGFSLDNSYLSAIEVGVEIWTGHGNASLSNWKIDIEYK